MIIPALINIAASTLKYKFFKIRTPIVVSVSITSRCNLRCVYCYSKEDNRYAKDVPKEEIFKIIDTFCGLGTGVVMLQGGEPLLHKDLEQIIDYIKNKKIYCSVTTNSLNLEKHIDALKKVDQIQLSIDGNKEITDRNRGSGVYESLLEAMQICHENNIPFHLHIVVTKDSTYENTLEPLIALANKYKTYLNFCIPAPTGSARGKELATNEKIHEFYKLILEKKKQGMPTNNSYNGLKDVIKWVENHPYNSFIASHSGSRKGRYPKCVMGDLVCWLDSDGLLHPCACRFGQSGFFYSVKDFGVTGAWQKLKDIPCHYCANSTEFNNLFNLRIGSVVNSLKFILQRH